MRPALKSFIRRAALPLGLAILAAAMPLRAQESLVALGSVYNNGVLESSTSPIGATVASSFVSTGNYTLTFAATGAFAGSTVADFAVETTMESVNSGDWACTAAAESVTADLLTVRVRVADVEDSAIPETASAANVGFFFVVRRIGDLGNGTPIPSRHLVAAGNVLGSGALDKGFGVGGVGLLTGRGGLGLYFLQISKPGAFTTDNNSDYVVLASIRHLGHPDVTVRAQCYSAVSDDLVNIHFRTDDVQQSPTSNSPVPVDTTFAFAVYRIVPVEASGAPNSKLLAAVASVDGATGNLLAGRAGFPGATLSSTRVSDGRYDIFVNAPGAFAGSHASRFAAIVNLNSTSLIDEIARSRVTVVNANQIRIDVNTDDVEHPNDADGFPADASFSVTVYDVDPVLRHDLRVGKNALPTGSRGRGIFNATGAGQALTLRLARRSRQSAFFRSEHAGASLDDLRIKAGRLPAPFVSQLLVTTPPRRNVTVAAKAGLTVSQSMRPGQTVSFQATFRYRSLKRRPRSSFLLRTTSGYRPANLDTNKVLLRPR